MRWLYLLSLLLGTSNSFSQSVFSDTVVLIRPSFAEGEVKIYLVREEMKSSVWPYTLQNSNNEFRIRIEVVDTNQVYLLRYKIKTIKSTNKKSKLETLKADMADGLEILYSLDKKTNRRRLLNLEEARQFLVDAMARRIENISFTREEGIALETLMQRLQDPAGVELYLKHFLVLHNLFQNPYFRNREDFLPAVRVDLFERPVLPGTQMRTIKSYNREKGVTHLYLKFFGNRDSAAKISRQLYQDIRYKLEGKYFKDLPEESKNEYECEFTVDLNTGGIKQVAYKSVEVFMIKTVTKIEARLLEEERDE